jgi:hypothetical protein
VIERYLGELDAELRVPRRLRRRIVSEAREHLHEAAGGRMRRTWLLRGRRFRASGARRRSRARFARELAIGTTRRVARHAGLLFVLSLVLWDVRTSSFIRVAPGWINDGPGSALQWIVGQVGLVAGIVSLVRARVARRSDTLDSARLRYAGPRRDGRPTAAVDIGAAGRLGGGVQHAHLCATSLSCPKTSDRAQPPRPRRGRSGRRSA